MTLDADGGSILGKPCVKGDAESEQVTEAEDCQALLPLAPPCFL